jgi:hypothetical protein
MSNNSAWTGKHLAYVPAEPTRSWKGVTRRLIACGTGAMMCASLLTPSAAFAADMVSVDGTEYAASDYVDGVGDDAKTWWWDGKDDLSLNNYNGGAIRAEGELNVSYSGTNTVTTDSGSGIISYDSEEDATATDGNLTVSGSEGSSLTVNASDIAVGGENSVTIKGAGSLNLISANQGISSAGDVTLDGANVNINVNGDSEYDSLFGVEAYGRVSIKNGTTLKANVTGLEGSSSGAVGIMSFGYNSSDKDGLYDAHISIEDSTVDVNASAKESYGLFAYPNGVGNGTISINNSTVHAVGGNAAIVAAGLSPTEGTAKGTITINGASIVSPEGAGICEYSRGGCYAQYIGLAGAETLEDASKDVLIQADKKDETPAEDDSDATVTPASAKTSGGSAVRLAQTGDASAAGVFAAAAAGVTALGAGAFLSRRRG